MPRAASSAIRNVFIVCLAVLVGGPAFAQPKAAEACYAGYGLTPAQKIKICSDVIDSGSVKALGLGLAYFNGGQALSNAGDPKGAITDYRMALRYYTEVIRNAAPSAQLVLQRGLNIRIPIYPGILRLFARICPSGLYAGCTQGPENRAPAAFLL